MQLVLPATHPLARKRRIRLEALVNEPFVLLPRDASPTLHDVIVGACRNAGFEPVLGQQAPQLSSVVNFVAAEFGVSLVPASVCQIQVEGVVYVDVAGANITIRLALASQEPFRTSKVANFLAIARQLTAPLAL
jgi:DNA-binding transcriptional LysR family regulator